MPKYVINGANDEFFLPTDTRYWWDQMPHYNDLNRFMMLPNTDHGIIGGLFGKTCPLYFSIWYSFTFPELLPSIHSWIKELLIAKRNLINQSGTRNVEHKTIDERNAWTLKLMAISNIPKFNWTHDPLTGS